MNRGLAAFAGVTGLLLAKKFFNGTNCEVRRDLSGQVAIITGGNSGIGRETALALAKQNCTVVITGRDSVKGEQAVKYIRELSGHSDIEYRSLDLSSRESVREFSNAIKDKFSRINILVNNAGISSVPELTVNADGFEIQIATNHFGHFYLTSLLWDLLKHSENLRIVNVSSRAHLRNSMDKSRKVQIDFQHLDGKHNYTGLHQYCVTKLANVLFTQQLAERLEKINPEARVLSIHPGVVRTDVARYAMVGWKKLVGFLLYPFLFFGLKNPTQGAQTTLYTVFQDKDNLKNGGYYDECKLTEINPFAKNPQNQKLLWSRTQQLLGITFPAK